MSDRAGTFVGLSAPPIFMAIATVVHITDADWHDPSGNATLTTLEPAYAATKAKSVAVTENNNNEMQANALADATGSNVPPAAFGAGCAAGQCGNGVNGAARAPTDHVTRASRPRASPGCASRTAR